MINNMLRCSTNWGEIFLNPQLEQIVSYAAEKGIILHASNGVNLNRISDDMIDCLVRCQFRELTVSIDGASNATYQQYRRGGDFDAVIENIKRLNACKERYGSPYPQLLWQFVVFGHNEHELPQAREMARQLNMSFVPKLNWNKQYSPIKNRDYVEDKTGLSVTPPTRVSRIELFRYSCRQLWLSPIINWDGKLLGCCHNRWRDFGNVFESGLRACIRGEKYVRVKRMLMSGGKASEDMPCFHCGVYQKMRSDPQSPRPYQRRDWMIPFAHGVKNVLKGSRN